MCIHKHWHMVQNNYITFDQLPYIICFCWLMAMTWWQVTNDGKVCCPLLVAMYWHTGNVPGTWPQVTRPNRAGHWLQHWHITMHSGKLLGTRRKFIHFRSKTSSSVNLTFWIICLTYLTWRKASKVLRNILKKSMPLENIQDVCLVSNSALTHHTRTDSIQKWKQ